jgi:hypothetical protein
MGTKNNPGAYDCYANAEPDEPMFILLARDPSAPWLVKAWAALRCGLPEAAETYMRAALAELRASGKSQLDEASPKLQEAVKCARDMEAWRAGRTKAADE